MLKQMGWCDKEGWGVMVTGKAVAAVDVERLAVG